MVTKFEMLPIYELLWAGHRQGSSPVESEFVSYLMPGVDVNEYEIRSAKPARRKDGGRDHAVGLTGARLKKVAPEL
ncbi:MAG: hypothetical protein STSR0009_21760 [Methanoregula sp.]